MIPDYLDFYYNFHQNNILCLMGEHDEFRHYELESGYTFMGEIVRWIWSLKVL
jgi:hypothetical protein